MIQTVARGLADNVRSPKMLVWLWFVLTLAALPATIAIGSTVASDLGNSTIADALRDGMDLTWLEEFQGGAEGLSETFVEPVLTRAALLYNLESWLAGGLFQAPPAVVAIGVLYALLWLLQLGGVLSTVAREEPFELRRFLSHGGALWGRFVRLALLSIAPYYGVYKFSSWLFPQLELHLLDVTSEKTALMYYLLAAGSIAFALGWIRTALDYAKVAIVVEERRSALLALARGLQFTLHHPLGSLGLAVFYGALYPLLGWLYLQFGTAANSTSAVSLAVFARIWLRIACLRSELALYRRHQFV